MLNKLILLALLLSMVVISTMAQDQRKIDSLQTELKKFEIRKTGLGSENTPLSDSLKANLLNEISFCYFTAGILGKTLEFSKQSEELSEKIGYKKGVWKAGLRIGAAYGMNHDFKQAMGAYQKALKAALETGEKEGAGKIYQNMAITCNTQGNFTDAKTMG